MIFVLFPQASQPSMNFDISELVYLNNICCKRKSFSLLTFSFKAGFKSRINKFSFILQCISDFPVVPGLNH